MSHPRRLSMSSSSRASSSSRPKSLVVQVLTRNGKEAEQAHSDGVPSFVTPLLQQQSPASSPFSSPSSSPSPSFRSIMPSISPSTTPSPTPTPTPTSHNSSMPSPPKTPSGLRIAVPSPGPVGPTPPPPPNYSVLPALDALHRFVLTGTLQQSLFGIVKLAWDRQENKLVAIKISRRDLSSISQARSGVTVLENVKKEAIIMKYIEEQKSQLQLKKHVSQHSSSNYAYMSDYDHSKSAATPTAAADSNDMDMQVDQQHEDEHHLKIHHDSEHNHSIEHLTKESPHSSLSHEKQLSPPTTSTTGPSCDYICSFVLELEDQHFHYLITDFAPGGDLYSVLTTYPSHRFTESKARDIFRQIVQGVYFLHERFIAHLDLSLENICFDANENVKIIDFGVAVLHPLTPSSNLTCSELCSNFFALSQQSPISTQPFSKPPEGGISQQVFLCKPIPHMHNKPGKIRYMSPELFSNQSWDAYKNDMFSLGVILYSLLTGRPPFQHADSSDIWYHVIASGQWLTPSIMNQPTAHVYTHVSMEALELVNRLIKPQAERWTCKQVLDYSWMNKQF